MNYTAIAQQQEQPFINDPKLQAEILVEGLSFPTSMAFIVITIFSFRKGRGNCATCFKWYIARATSIESRCK